MKPLLFPIIFLSFAANATNHYLSATGDDTNAGTTVTTSWKTITKLNSSFGSFREGDSVLFRRGDIFYGSIIVNKSGTAGAPIIVGAYGRGVKPIITGFTTVKDWTDLGSNIWESSDAVSTLPECNMVVINGVNTPMGRYPNAGYLTYEDFSGNASITSSKLSSPAANWIGAEVVVRKVAWIMERSPITAHSGATLVYKSASAYNAQKNWGFFIQNDSKTLDQQNEWYYNPSTKKIRIYSTFSPRNVQVATKDTLVKIQGKSYITFDGLSFTGSNQDAFTISADHIIIQHCLIDYSGKDAIWGALNIAKSTDFVFQYNTINHTNNNALNLRNNFTGALIQHNLIKNTGLQEGMMTRTVNGNQMAIGIQVRADNALIQYNEVDSTGYAGIEIYNNNDIVQYNLVNYCLLTLADGGGIYQWVGFDASGRPNSPKTGQKILHNIVLNAIGNNPGTTNSGLPQAQGIYADDIEGNEEIAYNTIAFCAYSGILLHNTTNMNVHDNTLYDNGTSVLFSSANPTNPIRTTTFNNNIIVSKTPTQYLAYFDSKADDITSFGSPASIDNNYWARPADDNIVFKLLINGKTNKFFNLAQWAAYSGFDVHSHKSPVTIKDVNDLRFEYNATNMNKTVALPHNYIDIKNVSYNGTITLASYTSVILIKKTE